MLPIQRPYDWTDEESSALLDDLLACVVVGRDPKWVPLPAAYAQDAALAAPGLLCADLASPPPAGARPALAQRSHRCHHPVDTAMPCSELYMVHAAPPTLQLDPYILGSINLAEGAALSSNLHSKAVSIILPYRMANRSSGSG